MGNWRISLWLLVALLALAGCKGPRPNLKPELHPEYVLPPNDDARFSSPPTYPKETLDTGQFKKDQTKPGDPLKDPGTRLGGTGGASRDDEAPGERSARETGDETALDQFAAMLDRDQLGRALRRLPETHRRVLVLRFYDDLELDEICGVLGCSRATFAVKLHRALAALRGALAAETTDAA